MVQCVPCQNEPSGNKFRNSGPQLTACYVSVLVSTITNKFINYIELGDIRPWVIDLFIYYSLISVYVK